MFEKIYITSRGDIHYWTNEIEKERKTLVFLPGLTADHRLFNKQIEYFEDKYNVFVWDAPGHASSYPFELNFNIFDKAKWLDEIIKTEGIEKPIIVGQSMGGYVGQAYLELFSEKLAGFIAIDSAPLQRKFVTGWELWLLKRMEPVYKYYPWKSLKKAGVNGVAVSEYGRNLMHDIITVYEGDQARYAALSGHGMKMLAEAMEADLPYKIACPALIICGEKDMAGSCKRYAKVWSNDTGIRLEWIKNAGHNSNTDKPEEINALIEELAENV